MKHRRSLGDILRPFGRALRRRCPNCGGGGIFTSWTRLLPACPTCGLPLERGESGYNVGAYMFNIAAAELVFALLFIGTLMVTWPNPPWGWLQWGAPVLMIVMPILFYPFSRALFLAFDLVVRPPHDDDSVRDIDRFSPR